MPEEAGCISVTKWSVDGICRFATTAQTEPWPPCGGTKLSVLFFKIVMHYSLADCCGWFLLNSKSYKMFNINVLTKSVHIKFWFWLVDWRGEGGCSSADPTLMCPCLIFSGYKAQWTMVRLQRVATTKSYPPIRNWTFVLQSFSL